MPLTAIESPSPSVQHRANDLFLAQHHRILARTDRMFAWLMLSQWVAGIVLAVTVSPRAWEGIANHIHPHVWAAVLLGGAIASVPVLLAFTMPGEVLTRHTIAVGQMLASALLIHLTGGRIETHFHVFGSLAFLAFYRDWRILVTATIVVAADHFVRGLYWPASVFGVISSSPWRWIEHAAWVLFEDGFLIASIRQGLSEMREVAQRQAALEEINRNVERQVADRTADLTLEVAERKRAEAELRAKHAELQAVHDCSPLGMGRTDPNGRCVYANRVLSEIVGLTPNEMLACGWESALHSEDRGRVTEEWRQSVAARANYSSTHRFQRSDGRVVWVSAKASPIQHDHVLLGYVATVEDISERKRVEQELDVMNKRLIETSRQAGMAEVATAVLHNVGNVLNSVNVSASLISDQLNRSRAETLSRVLSAVEESGGDLIAFLEKDRRGKLLPSLLNQLGQQLMTERASLIKESESLKKNVEHVKDIVAMQQSYARVSGVTEPVQVPSLIEDALRMNGGSIERHQIRIIHDLVPTLPSIITDKHKVLQILVNLVANAKYACAESETTPKEIILRACNGNGKVAISVIDNGIGIQPQNLTRIFSHGFTTRKHGHGFGLHSGALAAKELGGKLTAFSEGPGRGANFTLELPVEYSQSKL